MSISPKFSFSAALMLSVAGTPALADLTVDDAWNSWKTQINALGLTLAAEETRDGDALQIGELSVSATLPMGAGHVRGVFAGPRFEPLGDGSVRVSFPEVSQMIFDGDINDEGSLNLVLDAKVEGYEAVLSGTPERMIIKGGYDATTLSLASLTLNDVDLSDASGTMAMRAGSFDLTATTADGMINVEGTTAYDGYDMEYVFGIADGDSTMSFASSGFAENIVATHAIALPAAGMDLMALPAHLRGGLKLSLAATSDKYGTTEEARVDGEVLSLQKSEVSDYDATFSLDESGISVVAGTGEFTADVQIADLPFPISMTGASGTGEFAFPLLSTGAPQGARMVMDLQDLTVNEEVWAMVDAGGALPRDPLMLRLDLSGEVDLTGDLVDLATLEAMDAGTNPIVPVSATLKDLLLSVVGTELTGSGAFTFDASDTETIPGMPRPEGALDLKLIGANALIDRLVAMGLIPEDQAMGTRMMMGMIAVPGDGEDTLISHIEINDQGHVLANGQRLK